MSPRVAFKWCCILPLFVFFILAATALGLLPASPRMRRLLLMRNTSLISRTMLRLLGARVRVHHPERFGERQRGRMIVSNHVSYIDVFAIASVCPAAFITSVELRNTPVLGMLAALGGSLFVERRKVAGLKREIAEIADVLRHGVHVALFPEGTTSNGERVHAFKNALFDAAMDAGADVLPVCIRYQKIDSAPVDQTNRDLLFYYGGMTFAGHFPRLLGRQTIELEITPLPLVHVRQHESRKSIALAAHRSVAEAYGKSHLAG